jgi:ribosomal protein S27AE
MGPTSLQFAAIWFSTWGTLMTYNRISHEHSHALGALQRPGCPRCGEAMWLALIEPDKPDHDKRTFECPRCQHETTEIVKFR